MAFAAGTLPRPDDQKASVLTLSTGVRLKTDTGIAGGFTEPFAELSLKCSVSLPLISRGEGVNVRKLRPADRDHLAGGVELHRATAQWDHCPVEGKITIGELSQVAEHLGLTAVVVEDGMSEKAGLPGQPFG